MGIYEEIAKITAEKNEDLKIKAKIWKLTEISFVSCDLRLVVSMSLQNKIEVSENGEMRTWCMYDWHDWKRGQR